jgi:hypothetical protein
MVVRINTDNHVSKKFKFGSSSIYVSKTVIGSQEYERRDRGNTMRG